LVIAALVALLLLATAGSASPGPRPLRGVTLREKTGLRLLVASNPPFVLDGDSGRVTPVTVLSKAPRAVVSVLAAGQNAVVWLDRARRGRKVPQAALYVVRRETTRATRLSGGWSVVASVDGRAVWISAYRSARECTLRELWLDGRPRRAPRPFPCAWLDAGGSLGLIVHTRRGDALVDPDSLRTVLHAPQLLAVAGSRVLVEDREKRLTLADTTKQRQRLPWPSSIGGGSSQGGTDDAPVDPNGGSIALGFSDPAYQGDGTQVTDVWLLDAASGAFNQLPDMPAIVSLKRTSWAWTTDGRLVFLAETVDGTVVGVWKRGDSRIAVKRMKLPERNSGSDSFVPW